MFNGTDAISCSLIDQDDNVLFSKKRDSISEIYDIELLKLYKVIKLISKDFKTHIDYKTKVQSIFCSEIHNRENSGFFLLIKSFNVDKKLIAIFPLSSSYQDAFIKFEKTIEILSYYFNELEYLLIS